MTAATGAKNGCLCPHTPFATAHASAHASPAWMITRQLRRTRSQRVCIETLPRSAAPSSKLTTVLDQVEAQQRLGERPPVQVPALARIEGPRPGRAVGREEPDRGVALARRLLQAEP